MDYRIHFGIHMLADKTKRINTSTLCKNFASQSTTHGLRRISETEGTLGKLLWTVIFLTALAGCTYHCSFLIQKYLKFSKVTSTEEIHAKELDFPALTVCNLNILKKSFLEDQLEKNRNSTHDRDRGFCFASEDSFLRKSDAKDLSDIWANLGVTLEHLKTYGHKVYDLIVQCTYNSKDCFNQSITRDLPLETENITITDYPSTRLGYCHTIKLNQSTLGKVRRTGQTLGLTLTLNIERNEYWNLLSPEYGVRIMIHPRQAYPTVDRGGIVLHPGTKSYMSIRIREIERLPAPYGDCTKTFEDSPLSELLKNKYDDYLKNHTYYTYEFCQSVCREIHLLQKCECVEEQVNSTHKFCNPCSRKEEDCKEDFKSYFDDNETNACTVLCKPACQDTRYDVTLSTSEWPNLEFQEFVLKRWPGLRSDFVESPDDKSSIPLNETFLNKNFLRVHIFVQEMNYLRFMDIEAYTLPELFADLGGCLGLYIGVSLISIIEFQELLLHITGLFCTKLTRSFSFEDQRSLKMNLSRSMSRSVDDLMNMQHPNRIYDTNFRPEGPTPPIFWLRGKKDAQNNFKISDVENLAEEDTLRRKMCFKCLSDIENLRNGYLYRRRPLKRITKSVINTNSSS
ncbi:acid-sensing ion channel 1A [Nephila pilipes]|uniref:Acid-sensing ion channel 1A n=1 Tax=Nephila pilipes TaxID=299642 RepID=A0A8X6NK48_NEPPI|nr:acid-sensing ion channel 1A [Nephila pilipes]